MIRLLCLETRVEFAIRDYETVVIQPGFKRLEIAFIAGHYILP